MFDQGNRWPDRRRWDSVKIHNSGEQFVTFQISRHFPLNPWIHGRKREKVNCLTITTPQISNVQTSFGVRTSRGRRVLSLLDALGYLRISPQSPKTRMNIIQKYLVDTHTICFKLRTVKEFNLTICIDIYKYTVDL